MKDPKRRCSMVSKGGKVKVIDKDKEKDQKKVCESRNALRPNRTR